MLKKKIIITGSSGLLGSALIRKNFLENRIEGIYIGNYEMPNTGLVTHLRCDLTDQHNFFNFFKNAEISTIIHTAGIADTDLCEKEPKKAFNSNVIATKNVISLAKNKRAKLIYISTNAIFDGETPPYSEEDAPNPVNLYGKLKLECELLVKSNLKDYLIIRPILMYGLNNPHERESFFMRIIKKLESQQKINIVDDVFENPILSDHCAMMVWKLIANNNSGVYHLAGRDILSRYEASKIIAKVFSLDASLINPVSSRFFNQIARRPKNTSYLTCKIEKELGEKPLSLQEGLMILKRQMQK